ncbi:ATP-binding protein [uncultured Litoreibacter sp.]|uniref:ATP-binding response regulator n=1 Tax=uncultured Litoreibacter sp. TaxID=1392394 RepID=UPI002607FBA7|nr:ATP-binding protein [uncultured Litoreibacter sp.]
MAQAADPDSDLTRTGRIFANGSIVSWAAVAVLFAGVLVPDAQQSFAVAGVGLVLAAIAFLITLRRGRKAKAPARSELSDLIFHDERSVFVTASTGEVLKRNAAARRVFGDGGGPVLEKIIGKQFPNPNAIIFRLQAKAARLNAAQEDIVTRRARFHVGVHKLTGDRFLWAIEESSERSAVGRGADKISLPMMTVSGTGTILYMNEAMRVIAGERVKALDRLFVDVPKVSGERHLLKSKDGDIGVQVIIVPGSGGRSEYFLAPIPNETVPQKGSNLDLLEDFPVALLRIKADGRVEDANKLARGLLELEEKPGQMLSDLVGGLGRPITDWLADAAEGRALHQPEILRAQAGEEETYLQISLGRVIEDGQVTLVAMVTDATELKSLEAQFVQSQKMQAIGQLAGGVAHDFNNLLTAISGHCDLLMLRHDPGDMDYGDLEQINQNANRAASLVGQLLAFSRKQNLQLEVLDMRDTLSDLAHLLNRLVGAQITLNLTHDPQLMSVRADRRQMEQVIMNLVVNARDAMGGNGGEITIETRNAKLQTDLSRDRAVVPRGDYVVVKVRDDGNGIPKEKLTKIFEPFFTTKGVGEGTGLGLSTAYGIIKQSGGFIFVDSAEGKGTEFTIFFPTYDRPKVAEEAKRPSPVAVDIGPVDGVVLLVEDEAPVRAFASRALKLRGFQVLEADSGEEALTVLSDTDLNVDIVVTDVVMPGLDGPSWVKKAREDRPDMKVVFVSGYAEENFNQDQSDIPNSIFLPKPFSLNELTATVRGQLADLAA